MQSGNWIKHFLYKLTFFLFLVLVSANCYAETLYWVGGAGRWNDINRWALSSGGNLRPSTVPTSDDNVVFDANSGLTASSTISINETAYCKDITFECAATVSISYPLSLNIYGSATLFPGVKFTSNSSVYFKSTGFARCNGGTFSPANIYIEGELTLADDFFSGNIYLNSGKFITNSNKISAQNFESTGTSIRELDIRNAKITLSGYWEYSGTNATLLASNSRISTGYFKFVGISHGVYSIRAFLGISGHQYHDISIQTNISSASIGGHEGIFGGITARKLEIKSVNAFKVSGSTDETIITPKNTFDSVVCISKVAFYNSIVKENITFKETGLLINSTVKEAIFENPVGTSQIAGCDIENLKSKSSIIFGDGKYLINTIQDLTLSRNKIYTIYYTSTSKLTINGDIFLLGSSCDGYVYFKSMFPGYVSVLEKNGGDLNLSGVYAEYVKVTGNNFNVTEGVDGVGNSGNWNFSSIATSNTYYRIGGGGEWYDPTKWSLSSGGPVANCVPRELDNVIFDDNSGITAANKTVKTSDFDVIFCNNLNFNGSSDPAPIISAAKAYVGGSLILQEKMTYTIGETLFTGSGPNTIKSNEVQVSGSITLNNKDENGDWSILDNLNLTGDLSFVSGKFSTNNNSITANSFLSNNLNHRILNLGSSFLNLTNIYSYRGDLAILSPNTSSIVIKNPSYNTYFYGQNDHEYNNIEMIGNQPRDYNEAIVFSGANVKVKNLTFNSFYLNPSNCFVVYSGDNTIQNLISNVKIKSMGGNSSIQNAIFNEDAVINGNNSFDKATLNGNITLNGNNTFAELIFEDAKNHLLGGGTVQTIDKLTSKVTGCKGYMSLRSPGKAYLKSTGNDIVIPAVNMKNIEGDMSLGAKYYAWGEDEGGNKYWDFSPPVPKTLYWVGGGGNWNDPAHWSQTDGVPDGGCVPTKYDDVYFTNKSGNFTTAFPVAIESKDAFCRNMTWNDDVIGDPVLNLSYVSSIYSSLNVYGSVVLKGGMSIKVWNLYNKFKMHSEDSLIHSITTNGVKIPWFCIESDGKWELKDNFTLANDNDIDLKDGELDTKSFDITGARYFYVREKAKLKLNSSVVNVSNSMSIYGNIDSGTSHIIFSINSGTNYLNIYNNNLNVFNDITFNNDGYIQHSNGYSNGKIVINNLVAKGKFSTSGNSTNNIIKISKAYWGKGASIGSTPLTIGELIIENGYTYTFSQNYTHTFDAFETTGVDVCKGVAAIESNSATNRAIFIFTAPEKVKLKYVTLKSINNTSGFINVIGNDLGNNIGWTYSPFSGRNLYWVNGGGSWTDLSHWSETSGGTVAAACLPTIYDTVYFDENSKLTNTNKKISYSSYLSVNTMIVHHCDYPPEFNGSSDINIYGSLYFQNGVGFSSYSYPIFRFKSSNTGNTIFTDGVKMPTTVYFEGTGSWELLSEFQSNSYIYLNNGTLNTNGHDVYANSITTTTTTFNTLNMENSLFTLYGETFRLDGSTKLFAEGSTISFIEYGTNINANISAPSGTTFGNITVSNTRTTTITNNLNFKRAYFGGNVILNGSNTFDELIVEQGANKSITLNQGTTQTVKSNLQISGSPCRLTQIKTSVSGKVATFDLKKPFTLDFVGIQNITVLSNTLIVERNSDNLGGNTNITFKPKTGHGLIGLDGDKYLCNKGFPYTLTTDGFFPGPPAEFTWRKDGYQGEIQGHGATLTIAEPGRYWIYVDYKDAKTNSCNRKDSITVFQAEPVTAPSYIMERPVCHENRVNITISAPLGSEYTYSLQDTLLKGTPQVFQLNPLFSDVSAGVYYLVTKDTKGCYSDTVMVEITEPNILATASDIDINTPVTICFGTPAILTPSTTIGINPVFHWYTDAALTTSANAIDPSTGVLTSPPLIRDTVFYVTVSSDTLCENLPGTAKVVTIRVSPPLVLSASVTEASCGVSDGSINGTATGGTAPLEYSIDNSTWVNNSVFSNLSPGNYLFSVKDATGCTNSISVFIPSKVNAGGEHSYSDAKGYDEANHEIKECIYLGSLDISKVQGAWNPNVNANTAQNDDGINFGIIPNSGGYTDLTHKDFLLKSNGNLHVRLAASNFSNANAYVRAWIDFDNNWEFDVADSSNRVIVNPLTTNDTIELIWENAAIRMVNGVTYLRVRISNEDVGANKAFGSLANGEVEDYRLNFNLIHVNKTADVKHKSGKNADIADTIVYTIKLVNLQKNESFQVVDYLPENTIFVPNSEDPSVGFSYVDTERKLLWNVTNSSGDETLTFKFEATVIGYPSKGDEINNLAYAVYQGDSITSDTARIKVNPLFAQDDCSITLMGISKQVDIRPNDTDPSRKIVLTEIETPPNQGTVNILVGGQLEYIPKPNFAGMDSVEYKISAPNTFAKAWLRIAVVEVEGKEACKNGSHSVSVIKPLKPADKIIYNWYSEEKNLISLDTNSLNVNIKESDTVVYLEASFFNCTTQLYPIDLKIIKDMVYADVRVQICNDNQRSINLSKFVDSSYFQSITWKGSKVTLNGEILDVSELSNGIHRYEFEVTNTCGTGKALLYLGVGERNFSEVDTLVVCKDFAEEINLNRVLGLDVFEGKWVYNNQIVSAKETTGVPYAGALVFDGKTAFGDSNLDIPPFKTFYKGADARIFEFEYIMDNKECFHLSKRKIVVIVVEVML